jgi:hypothetical protein
MAICTWCDREMLLAASCKVEALHRSGVAVALPRYGEELRYGPLPMRLGRCGDCGVRPGGFHHLGCDVVECPSCGHQLLSCDCQFDEDGREDDDDEEVS